MSDVRNQRTEVRDRNVGGRPESAGINRHRVGDERALHESGSCSIVAPSYALMTSNGIAKR